MAGDKHSGPGGDEDIILAVKGMPEEEFRKLARAVDRRRPTRSFSELDLEHELIEQYDVVRGLQTEVIRDDDTPANQRAQVANAVASTLQQLVKMQSDFYTAERFKRIEGMMIKAIQRLPKEAAEEFIREYEEAE